MRRFATICLALVATLGLAAPALADPTLQSRMTLGNPSCGAIEVLTEDGPGWVAFYMRNTYCGEMTVDLAFPELANMAPSSYPATFVLKPGQTALVTTLQQVNRAQAYRWRWQSHYRFGDATATPSAYVYKLPYRKGTSHAVIQGFNGSVSHYGNDAYAVDLDFKQGTPILAARDGVVVAFNEKATSGGMSAAFLNDELSNWVLVRHSDGTIGRYYHLRPQGVAVRAGQKVKVGDLLGYSGNTGHSTGPHLHFDVMTPRNGKDVQTHPVVFKTLNGGSQGEELEQGESYVAN